MDIEDTHDIPENRGTNGMNATENKLYNALKEIGLNPTSQYTISNITVDFAFPDANVVVEVNGPYHYTKEGKERDAGRKYVLNHLSPGWRVIEVDAKETYHNPEKIAKKIKRILIMRGYTPGSSYSGYSHKR